MALLVDMVHTHGSGDAGWTPIIVICLVLLGALCAEIFVQ